MRWNSREKKRVEMTEKKLFERFSEIMPETNQITINVCDRILKNIDESQIKNKFSKYFEKIHDDVYADYLFHQKDTYEQITDGLKKSPSFEELDKFFTSLGNSRKSRAGRAFELILKEMLKNKLSYPIDGQVQIGGAKPDFVMPSKKHFQTNPLDCLLLTAKRTLRERWRQVVTEAFRTYSYFLATIDKDISANQLRYAEDQKIYIVTTEQNISSNNTYASASNVISFEKFISSHLDPSLERWKS